MLEKRKTNARWTFDRSAKQAGFFENGDTRLIAPILSGTDTSVANKVEHEAVVMTVPPAPPSSQRHPFIEGLLQTLPATGDEWEAQAQAKWLEAAAKIFGLIYKTKTTDEVQIIVS